MTKEKLNNKEYQRGKIDGAKEILDSLILPVGLKKRLLKNMKIIMKENIFKDTIPFRKICKRCKKQYSFGAFLANGDVRNHIIDIVDFFNICKIK